MVSLNKIVQAKRKISAFVYKTPFAFSPRLSEICGAKVWLKEENLQRTGAYKIRGAYNKIANLSSGELVKGVVAASAGNHAQGVAISAREFKTRAVIVMPESTPLLKVAGTKDLGAEVILKGDNFDEAYAYAVDYAREHGMTFVHPFDDEFVQAGQGTVGLEMLDEVGDLDVIIVPVGGGGLASGVASCVKQENPKIKVVCVGAKGAPAMFESYKAKKATNSKSVRTIADGIAVRDASEVTLAHIMECADEFVQVDDEEIATIKSSRKMIIQVTLIDKPGALLSLTDALKEANANIVKIDYDRFSTELEYGDASITITLETKGADHQAQVAKTLKGHGFEFRQIF